MPLVLNGATSGSTTIQATDAVTQTITLPNNSGTVLTTASTFGGTGPAFSAYGTAKQSLANNTFTKIAFNTKLFDTATAFDTTNYRFLPLTAGYYQVNATIGSTPNVVGVVGIYLYKNGSLYSRGNAVANSNQGPDISLSALISLNGSTDYIEIYAYQNTGGSLNMGSDASNYPFSAALIRSA